MATTTSSCISHKIMSTLWDILDNIPNEREFYQLQVVQIVGQKINCVQSYG